MAQAGGAPCSQSQGYPSHAKRTLLVAIDSDPAPPEAPRKRYLVKSLGVRVDLRDGSLIYEPSTSCHFSTSGASFGATMAHTAVTAPSVSPPGGRLSAPGAYPQGHLAAASLGSIVPETDSAGPHPEMKCISVFSLSTALGPERASQLQPKICELLAQMHEREMQEGMQQPLPPPAPQVGSRAAGGSASPSRPASRQASGSAAELQIEMAKGMARGVKSQKRGARPPTTTPTAAPSAAAHPPSSAPTPFIQAAGSAAMAPPAGPPPNPFAHAGVHQRLSVAPAAFPPPAPPKPHNGGGSCSSAGVPTAASAQRMARQREPQAVQPAFPPNPFAHVEAHREVSVAAPRTVQSAPNRVSHRSVPMGPPPEVAALSAPPNPFAHVGAHRELSSSVGVTEQHERQQRAAAFQLHAGGPQSPAWRMPVHFGVVQNGVLPVNAGGLMPGASTATPQQLRPLHPPSLPQPPPPSLLQPPQLLHRQSPQPLLRPLAQRPPFQQQDYADVDGLGLIQPVPQHPVGAFGAAASQGKEEEEEEGFLRWCKSLANSSSGPMQLPPGLLLQSDSLKQLFSTASGAAGSLVAGAACAVEPSAAAGGMAAAAADGQPTGGARWGGFDSSLAELPSLQLLDSAALLLADAPSLPFSCPRSPIDGELYFLRS